MADNKFDTNELRKHVDHNITVKHLGELYNQVCLMCLTCRETLVELDVAYTEAYSPKFKVGDYVEVQPCAISDTGFPSKHRGQVGMVIEVTPMLANSSAAVYDLKFGNEEAAYLFYSHELELHETLPTPPEVKQAFEAGEMFVVDPVLTTAVNSDPEPDTTSFNKKRVDEYLHRHGIQGMNSQIQPVPFDDLDPQQKYIVVLVQRNSYGNVTRSTTLTMTTLFVYDAKFVAAKVNKYLNWYRNNKGN